MNKDTHVTEYQTQLSNHFQLLQHATDVDEQWTLFKEAITESAQETLGRRQGT